LSLPRRSSGTREAKNDWNALEFASEDLKSDKNVENDGSTLALEQVSGCARVLVESELLKSNKG
jgi:hypothetical protein